MRELCPVCVARRVPGCCWASDRCFRVATSVPRPGANPWPEVVKPVIDPHDWFAVFIVLGLSISILVAVMIVRKEDAGDSWDKKFDNKTALGRSKGETVFREASTSRRGKSPVEGRSTPAPAPKKRVGAGKNAADA